MANVKKVLPSGAVLEVQPASWKEANHLKKVVMRELKSVGLDFGSTKLTKDFLSQEVSSEVWNTLKNLFSQLLGSDEVETALWSCMGRVLYNNRKVTEDTFEPEEARADYLLVQKEVLVANLLPFFKNAGSLLKESLVQSVNGQGLGS